MRCWKEIPLFKDVSEADWSDWRWQWKHRIDSIESLSHVVSLSPEAILGIQQALTRVRMAITPYYASLMDPYSETCPIRLQAVPRGDEILVKPWEHQDPLAEEADSPVEGLVHRYPDRVLLLVTELCSMYCRHCTRRRVVGVTDKAFSQSRFAAALEYIRCHKEIRDVLVSGGDPLTLSDERLDFILKSIRDIPSVEIIRIGSRIPVVMPQRITKKLAKIVAKYQPVYLNTQFNHPKEITAEAAGACAILADHGIPLGNQSVLLRGVNNCPVIMGDLVRQLVKIRVKPYYIYQCDLTWGLEHFRTPIGQGLEIMESLRGHTTGFAVPTYVVDAPGGGGKIPLSPQYILSASADTVIVRNFEGVISAYREPAYNPQDRVDSLGRCRICGGFHNDTEGVASLLSGDKVCLVPDGTGRLKRRQSMHI